MLVGAGNHPENLIFAQRLLGDASIVCLPDLFWGKKFFFLNELGFFL